MSAGTLTVSSRTPVERKTSRRPALGIFERFLSVWVVLCIVAGIARSAIGYRRRFRRSGGWRLPASICR